MREKLIAYLGFANKSGSLLFGVDNIEAKQNKVVIAIYDKALSDNSVNKLHNIAIRNKMLLFESEELIDDLLTKKNCKAIGIISRDLAEAIKDLNYLKEVRN